MSTSISTPHPARPHSGADRRACGQRRPPQLFLDAPVSALNIAHQLHVMRIAREFAEAGDGVIAMMHDRTLTAMFADRIAIMSGWHIRAAPPSGKAPECTSQ
ncbi:hypothetical protein Q4543_00190 [Salipiger sp. 1_MG-2023]|uniref:hypothetical protein n=1 Tax=Salipiger sp. 1_MG-2023 TaxID=3062665 RepID=UPI0026E260DF|nr:hypothetical protein [Salipiger sp. 1_MG-2023]MDO6583926.1 hypothetical protein [Salipiger sp. 1_MG-2023]